MCKTIIIIIIIIITIVNSILIESDLVFIIDGCLGLKRHYQGPDMWCNIAHIVTCIYNLWKNSVLLCLLLIRAITWLSTGSTGEHAKSAFTHKTSSFEVGKSGNYNACHKTHKKSTHFFLCLSLFHDEIPHKVRTDVNNLGEHFYRCQPVLFIVTNLQTKRHNMTGA